MREIVFRGKRTDNGEWVEGWYIHTKRHHCIITGCIDDGYVVYGHYASDVAMYVVNPATVGQYTGLKDKNGNPIYEGHIVKCNHSFFTAEAEKAEAKKPRKSYGKEIEKMTLDYFKCRYWRNYVVSFHDGRIRGQNGSDTCYLKQSYIRNHEVEIIGNIHDNPELMEVR